MEAARTSVLDEAATPREPAPPTDPPVEHGEGAPPPPRPPISAAAPAGCPDDEAEDEGFVRPSLWELIRLEDQELIDRVPQLSRDASHELAGGLAALGAGRMREGVDAAMRAPDRHRDGFDVGVAMALHAATIAYTNRRLDEAVSFAETATEQNPSHPLAHALLAMAHAEIGELRSAQRSMSRAAELEPEEPAIQLALARMSADAGELGVARSSVDAYLTMVPEDSLVRTWRARIAARAELSETFADRSWDGIRVLFHDGGASPLDVDAIMRWIHDAMGATARVSGRPRRRELTVVVYATPEDLRRATCSPSWSGAIFDGVLHLDRARMARPDAERTVRHEAAHAQLAQVRGAIPFWLNEGLAQWIEGDLTAAKRGRLLRMAQRGVWIPFESLEGSFLVIEDPTDAAAAYDQSLAMVRWLIAREGQRSIADALERIEAGASHDVLTAVSPGADGPGLLRYLASLEAD